ncbi:PLP-dependent transferase [Phellopilus nigrolimitatus]|nr:PLP-dependent transferase [Phellopilus nigrolimitatus]
MSSTTTETETASTLGQSVPPFTPHAISVSLPTWQDTVGYEEGEKRVVDKMVTGYPRFFIHTSIQKLATICEKKFGISGERCVLFPSKKVAEFCREFMIDRSPDKQSPLSVRLIEFLICPEDSSTPTTSSCLALHIVLFPADAFPLAKQFWQHTGMGISSRTAERCLTMIPGASAAVPTHVLNPVNKRLPSKPQNRHYSNRQYPVKTPSSPTSPVSPMMPAKSPEPTSDDMLTNDHARYLEERYGRNLPLGYAAAAKRALRRRIAGVLVHDHCNNTHDALQHPFAGGDKAELGPSSRGVESVTEDDVFLYPNGMSAIWAAHHLALLSRPVQKSVCFGFPYTDTLKILQKWGPGCHFFGLGLDSDIDALEKLLDELSPDHSPSSSPPILALFTEFASNPLLRSADLPRLRMLADKYNFLIIVDETVGNFVNVSVLPYADIVVSSLTKVFSGDSNVMGGRYLLGYLFFNLANSSSSLVLNPSGKHYDTLKSMLENTYEDIYFDEDAIFMERNSRNFKRRVFIINENTEAVCELLKARQTPAGIVKEVFYPKFTTRKNYDVCRAADLPAGASASAFGGLFSVTFASIAASRAFFDALACHKGPSLGTSFTLACPYTVLAHYAEMEWAAEYGVEEGLVRVSVGTEERGALLRVFERALDAAGDVSRSGKA